MHNRDLHQCIWGKCTYHKICNVPKIPRRMCEGNVELSVGLLANVLAMLFLKIVDRLSQSVVASDYLDFGLDELDA